MLRNLTTLALNLIAGVICFSTMPHLSGACFGLALSCCFDVWRAWPSCGSKYGDHLCNRLKWHLGKCRCYDGYGWRRGSGVRPCYNSPRSNS